MVFLPVQECLRRLGLLPQSALTIAHVWWTELLPEACATEPGERGSYLLLRLQQLLLPASVLGITPYSQPSSYLPFGA